MNYRNFNFIWFAVLALTPFAASAQKAPVTTSSPCVTGFSKTLRLGSEGSEVLALQRLLNQDPSTLVSLGGLGSSGNESTHFGQATRAAVMKFQIKYRADTLTPAHLRAPTGVVGTLTRAKLNSLCAASSKGDVLGLTTDMPSASSSPKATTAPAVVRSSGGGGGGSGITQSSNTAPVIVITSTSVQIIKGANFSLMDGVTAKDAEDGDLTASIKIDDSGFSTSTVGVYTIKYSVADKGNLTVTATRTISVYAPALQLSGDAAATSSVMLNGTDETEVLLRSFTLTAGDSPVDINGIDINLIDKNHALDTIKLVQGENSISSLTVDASSTKPIHFSFKRSYEIASSSTSDFYILGYVKEASTTGVIGASVEADIAGIDATASNTPIVVTPSVLAGGAVIFTEYVVPVHIALKVSASSNNPQAGKVAVSSHNSTRVALASFTLTSSQAEMMFDRLSFTASSTGASVGEITTDFYLLRGDETGVSIASASIASSTENIQTVTLLLDSTENIEKDTTQQYTLVARVNKVGGAFTSGDQLQVVFSDISNTIPAKTASDGMSVINYEGTIDTYPQTLYINTD